MCSLPSTLYSNELNPETVPGLNFSSSLNMIAPNPRGLYPPAQNPACMGSSMKLGASLECNGPTAMRFP